jgi:hypothetical protein
VIADLLSAIRRGVGRVPGLNRATRALVAIVRQWPWICPRGVIDNAATWIERTSAQSSWYARQRGHWYRNRYQAAVHSFVPPSAGASVAVFRNDMFRRTPEAGVFCFRGAYIFSDEGAVLSQDNRLFGEFVHHFGTRELRDGPYFRPFATFRAHVHRRDEWIAMLAAPECRNYYHWLFDVLPRLHLLEEHLDQIEYFAVPSGLSAAQFESLAMLGVQRERVLELNRGEKLYCERLLVPSLPGSEGAVPRWSVEFLRSRLIRGPLPDARRRIFLSRGDTSQRRLVNEAEVAAALAAQGFEVLTTGRMTLAEQIRAFQEADLVVACHGAGLANLVFSGPCRVLELLSPDYLRPDCYFTLSRLLGHDYRALVGEKAGEKWGDIHVDADRVAREVQAWSAG